MPPPFQLNLWDLKPCIFKTKLDWFVSQDSVIILNEKRFLRRFKFFTNSANLPVMLRVFRLRRDKLFL